MHLELEERIAKFLGLEEAIVYSYGFVAISSSIAAYCKKSDVIFADEHANFPIQQGLLAAKSKLVTFNHNDAKSFETMAERIAEEEKNKKKKSRKFLVIEAVSWKTGQICSLLEFLEVAEKYKIRVFLEESYSIGILGKTGKGLTEHLDVGPNRVDMIIGTLENALGSIGGFCAGTHMTIEHQRLSGSGYIFSASLPTFLVQAVIKSIDVLEDKPNKIRQCAKEFHDVLQQNYRVLSDAEVPYKVFNVNDEKNREEKLKRVYEYCKEKGVHFLMKDGNLIINLNLALFDDKRRSTFVYEVLEQASTLN